MWTHVSDAALMDVVEGAAGERAEQHVARCAGCRARVDEARAALGFAAAAAVPEPIPAYWDVMRRRVGHALVEARVHARALRGSHALGNLRRHLLPE